VTAAAEPVATVVVVAPDDPTAVVVVGATVVVVAPDDPTAVVVVGATVDVGATVELDATVVVVTPNDSITVSEHVEKSPPHVESAAASSSASWSTRSALMSAGETPASFSPAT
jgi:hypothetical protein